MKMPPAIANRPATYQRPATEQERKALICSKPPAQRDDANSRPCQKRQIHHHQAEILPPGRNGPSSKQKQHIDNRCRQAWRDSSQGGPSAGCRPASKQRDHRGADGCSQQRHHNGRMSYSTFVSGSDPAL